RPRVAVARVARSGSRCARLPMLPGASPPCHPMRPVSRQPDEVMRLLSPDSPTAYGP
ncbi:MAG: hypothetical protein JWN57_1362, partial [Frankiales bacterium]|nr:hypothetical protein [Frankiales bacterium]